MTSENRKDPADLAKLVEFELSRLRDADASRGWTTRALVIAWATLTWIGLGTVKSADGCVAVAGLADIAKVVALFFFMMLVARGVHATLTARPVIGVSNRIRHGQMEFGHSRSTLASYLLIAILLIGLWHVDYVSLPNRLHSAAVAASAYSLAAVMLLALVVSFTMLPIKQAGDSSPKVRWVSRLFWGSFLACNAVAVIGLLKVAPYIEEKAWVQGWVVFAMCIVVLLMVRQISGQPLVDVLVQLRRDLVLGGADTDQIAERLQTALFGLSFDDYVQTDFARVLSRMARMREALRGQALIFEKVAELTSKENLSEGDVTVLRSLHASVQDADKQLQTDKEELVKEAKRLARRMKAVAGGQKAPAMALSATFSQKMDELASLSSEVHKTRNDLRAKMQALISSDGKKSVAG